VTSPAALDALIDEITVDAYNDAEQEAGFLIAATDALACGEIARLAGREVELLAVDHGPDVRAGLRAIVRVDGDQHEVALADLVLAGGSELALVVSAYRRWLGWR
jgi:hypothetical protein